MAGSKQTARRRFSLGNLRTKPKIVLTAMLPLFLVMGVGVLAVIDLGRMAETSGRVKDTQKALDSAQELAAAAPVTDFRSRLFGRRGVSLPYVNYGGPLWRDEAALGQLLDRIVDLNREQGWRSTELRMRRRVESGLVERRRS